jgi:hypothetical protein
MKTTNFSMQIRQAISDVVTKRTLPPQIDYQLLWRIKEQAALRFIETLPEDIQKEVNLEIEKQVDSYYFEDEDGISTAYMDSLF